MDGPEFGLDGVDDRLLAVQAADAGRGAAFPHPLAGLVVRVDQVELPDRADVRIAGVGAAHAGGVGRHGADLLLHLLQRLAQPDGVAVGLGHLAAIEAGHPGRLGQQRLGLGQDDAAAALEIAEQPLAIADGEVLLAFEQRPGDLQRLVVALLLVAAAQVAVELGVLLAHLADGLFGLLLEARLAPVDVVEAAGDLAGQFHVRDLILPHRHAGGLVDEDVRALQQRIAQKAVGGEILLLELFLLVLVGGHPFQPAQGGDHRQQQVQFGMLRHARLDEEMRHARIDAGRQPVDHHVPDARRDDVRLFVVGGERMPVGHEEEAVVLVLQLDPVLQHAVIVAQMELAGRPHAGQDATVGGQFFFQGVLLSVSAGQVCSSRWCRSRPRAAGSRKWPAAAGARAGC